MTLRMIFLVPFVVFVLYLVVHKSDVLSTLLGVIGGCVLLYLLMKREMHER